MRGATKPDTHGLGRTFANGPYVTRTHRTVAQVISLLGFTVITTSVVGADAITGAPSGVSTTDVSSSSSQANAPIEGESGRATSYQVSGTTLFDETGSSLLVISPSQQIDLFAPREKLRGGGQGGWSSGGDCCGGGGGSLIPDGVITGLGSGVPSSSIGNVSFNSGGNPVGSNPAAPVVTPEPSSLILLGSGIAMIARRLTRQRRLRRTG